MILRIKSSRPMPSPGCTQGHQGQVSSEETKGKAKAKANPKGKAKSKSKPNVSAGSQTEKKKHSDTKYGEAKKEFKQKCLPRIW